MEFTNGCGPCHGSGYYGANSKDICVVCSGVGALRFEGDSRDYQACGPCHGSGYYGANSKDTCDVCNGLGLINLKNAPKAILPRPSDAAIVFWTLIHPIIARVARDRFDAGHFADSVEAALKEVNSNIKARVKALTGNEFDGADLMYKAFSPKSPLIRLDDLSTVTGSNIQQGYMYLFAGSMIGIRNPKAHENVIIDSTRAIHFLFLASLLMYKLDDK